MTFNGAQEPGFLGKQPYPLLCLPAPRMLVLPLIGRVWTTLQDRGISYAWFSMPAPTPSRVEASQKEIQT